jgi:hypothetical protein
MIQIWGRHLASRIALLMALFSLIFLANPGEGAVDASPKDDAYHYMKNGIDDQRYQEWWRFYVLDNDTCLMLLYLLSDPDNISKNGKIEVQALAMQNGQPAALGAHQSRGFGGDSRSPMLEIDGSGFSLQGDSDLHVWGSLKDGVEGDDMSWDLTFQPLAKPWFAIPVQAHLGPLAGDWIKWLVYMPSAEVRGSLTIDNRTVDILGKGYHDHAWGRFALSDARITTAWAVEPLDVFSLSFGQITGETLAFLGLEKDGKSMVFPQNKIKVSQIGHSSDNKTRLSYPFSYRVAAESGEYELNFTVDVLQSEAINLDFLSPEPGLTIFHQISLLQGTLTSRYGESYEFKEEGISTFWAARPHPLLDKMDVGSVTSMNNTMNLSAQNQSL